ncbi:MAG: DMT family transporter [Chloroflexi bacterium]|nr:DMT family transporter [Chloroflexota bacterium]
MLGVLSAILAATSWGVSAIFVRLALQHMHPAVGTLASLVVGFVFILTISLALQAHAFLDLTVAAFGWFALLGFLNYLLGSFFNYSSMHLAGIARAAPLVATTPVFAAVWAIGVAGERPAGLTLVGGSAIVLGVAMMLTERRTG